MKKVEDYVRSIPDYPEEGVIFRDITTVIKDPEGFSLALDEMEKFLEGKEFDLVVGTESRGFIIGAPIARDLGKGLVLIRKKGKLPCDCISEKYDLEYGTAEIEIHRDAISPGQKVVVVDDLMATGGTVAASIRLVERLGGEVVKVVFLMELAGLKGREKLGDYDIDSVVIYPGK